LIYRDGKPLESCCKRDGEENQTEEHKKPKGYRVKGQRGRKNEERDIGK
jgi:hypothetical protein